MGSSLLVLIIQNKTSEHWHLTYIIRRIKRLLGNLESIKLIYGDQNSVADRMAKKAHRFQERHCFFRTQDHQVVVLKLIIFDRLEKRNMTYNTPYFVLTTKYPNENKIRKFWYLWSK